MSEVEKLLKIKRYAWSQRNDAERAIGLKETKPRQKVFNAGASTAYEDIIRHIDLLVKGIFEESFERKAGIAP